MHVLKRVNLKMLVQKVMSIVVIQGVVYGIFLLIDPGFLDSLLVYFWFVALGSMVAIVIAHVRAEIHQDKEQARSILDEPDWSGK